MENTELISWSRAFRISGVTLRLINTSVLGRWKEQAGSIDSVAAPLQSHKYPNLTGPRLSLSDGVRCLFKGHFTNLSTGAVSLNNCYLSEFGFVFSIKFNL